MEKYDHKKIEQKWRERWEQANIYKTDEGQGQDKRKCYVLDMFPYPSGDGLHVGHPKGYIATDIYSRFKKMNGFSVLHPMGWDAFGLPAENYAIKNKVHPRVAVSKNIARFKEQLGRLGFNYDWSREINTTDPAYYKWTQWIFLKLLEKGLAYESHEPINWCPSCQTGLANEDLENGRCERCGSAVEKRPMRQWMLKITDYAERLLKDLDELEWPESIKESQRNWIGRSTGSEIKFLIKHFSRNNAELTQKIAEESQRNKIKVFTTRPDTLFGVTFMAISPELAQKWLNVSWLPSEEVKKYIGDTLTTRATQSVKDNPEKTGIFSGVYATNPANQEDIPVWVVNYVLGDVGTGAIMAVPAHDERDYEFAKKFKLPIVEVIQGGDVSKGAYIGEGVLINSSQFDKLPSEKAKKKITEFVGGEMATTYRLKDWVFSRQRYWGEPIPVIHCDRCNVVPVPEKDLPVMLPEVERYEPTGTGESPLAAISEWVNTTCPTCGGPAKRETNTMPQWAGSSWYYIAYCISESLNPSAGGQVSIPISEQISKPEFRNNITRWLPVDMYVGGTEHATRHLIYARFWHKFLFDIGVVSTPEPFARLKNQGLIMGEDGRKMGKRYGNVINPDDVVEKFGADTLRVYEMFMGPFEEGQAWSADNMVGSRRFLEKVWRIAERMKEVRLAAASLTSGADVLRMLHQTIKKVTDDIENFKFNTAISQMMIAASAMETSGISRDDFKYFLIIFSPFAPHLAQELWENLGEHGFIYKSAWPQADETLAMKTVIRVAIQINGKVRDEMEVSAGITEAEIIPLALAREKVKLWISGKTTPKVLYVKGSLVSIVVT